MSDPSSGSGEHMWPPQGPDEYARQLREQREGGEVFEYEAVPYGLMVQAVLPMDRWSAVYFSWLSLKGFLAGVYQVEDMHLYATQAGGRVWVTMIVTFSSPRALASWLEEGYAVEEMLRDVGVPDDDIRTSLIRDIA